MTGKAIIGSFSICVGCMAPGAVIEVVATGKREETVIELRIIPINDIMAIGTFGWIPSLHMVRLHGR